MGLFQDMGARVDKLVVHARIAGSIAGANTKRMAFYAKRMLENTLSEKEPNALSEKALPHVLDLSARVTFDGNAGSENAAAHEPLSYACPHCGKRFPVSEDSDEYLVACPGCGKQLDLTELNPL